MKTHLGKNIITLVLIASLGGSLPGFVSATDLESDTTETLYNTTSTNDNPGVLAANRLAQLGIIENHADRPDLYNLAGNITRREMLKVMMNLSSVEVPDTCEGNFTDLPASDWGCKYAEAGLRAGFIAANPRFRPNDWVTEAESLKMIMQAKGFTKAPLVEDWADAYTQAAFNANILTGTTTVSRVNAAKRLFTILASDAAIKAEMSNGGTTDDDTDSGTTDDNTEDVLDVDLFDQLFGTGVFEEDTNTGTTQTGTTQTGTTQTGTTQTGTTQTPTGEIFTVDIISGRFSPETISVNAGDTVNFINRDTQPHWPASANHPTHTIYPGSSIDKCGTSEESKIFDACGELRQGETFSFTFYEKGQWTYHDHLNPQTLRGTVIVK